MTTFNVHQCYNLLYLNTIFPCWTLQSLNSYFQLSFFYYYDLILWLLSHSCSLWKGKLISFFLSTLHQSWIPINPQAGFLCLLDSITNLCSDFAGHSSFQINSMSAHKALFHFPKALIVGRKCHRHCVGNVWLFLYSPMAAPLIVISTDMSLQQGIWTPHALERRVKALPFILIILLLCRPCSVSPPPLRAHCTFSSLQEIIALGYTTSHCSNSDDIALFPQCLTHSTSWMSGHTILTRYRALPGKF